MSLFRPMSQMEFVICKFCFFISHFRNIRVKKISTSIKYFDSIIFFNIEYKQLGLEAWSPIQLYLGGLTVGAKKKKILGGYSLIPCVTPRPQRWLFWYPKVFEGSLIPVTRWREISIFGGLYTTEDSLCYCHFYWNNIELGRTANFAFLVSHNPRITPSKWKKISRRFFTILGKKIIFCVYIH